MALRALTLRVVPLETGVFVVEGGAHTHHVTDRGECDCLPYAIHRACKHTLATALVCGHEDARATIRALAARLCVDYRLTRKAS